MSEQLAVIETNQQVTLKGYFSKDDVKAKFHEMLGKKAQGFITSVLQIANSNELLKNADPISIYNAACTAATMDLPINANLGFAWIVPYNQSYKNERGQWSKKQVAQFQIGWKGLVQLAQRTGQYLRMNVIEVYENQFKGFNSLTEELDADFSIAGTGTIVGYCAYFKLINGFEKIVYWTTQKVTAHGTKYSKSFATGVWKDDFDSMAKKTVLKHTISKWGILSIELQKAIVVDQAIINDEDATDVTYIDNEPVVQVDKEHERLMYLIEDSNDVEKLKRLLKDAEKYPDLIELINAKTNSISV